MSNEEKIESHPYTQELSDSPVEIPEEIETTTKKKRHFLIFLNFPPSVWFIIGNELCERFAFYGFKTILALYLVDFLQFKEDTATTIIHTFVFLAYFFPLIGGALADTLLGKFWTIAILSLVYCLGQVLIAVTAIPGVTGNPILPSTHSKGHPPHWWGVAIGLTLVAIGTGGIKPCVASFGGDQFKKDQGDLVSSYFAMFYLSINIGSTVSSFLTPLLSDQFGYAVAFAVPAVLLLIAVVIFFAGYKTYTMNKPQGNVIGIVIKVFYHAIRSWCSRSSRRERVSHWLDRAKEKMPEKEVEDVKCALKVIIVLLPLLAFWSLFDQHETRWVFQGKQMDRDLFGFNINPGMMSVFNPLCIMILIPIFDQIIYRLIARVYDFKPLRRITVGFLFTMASFLSTAVIEIFIHLFGPGKVHILWQIVPHVLLSIGEILVSVTGLEFAYSQAPKSMKSLMQACWLLTVSGGNVIVAVLASLPILPETVPLKRMYEFLFFVAFLAFFLIIFLLIARKYKYVNNLGDDEGQKNEYELHVHQDVQLDTNDESPRDSPVDSSIDFESPTIEEKV